MKKNCSTSVTRKTIEAAVKSVCDKEDRSKNVIIYGIEQTSEEVLSDKVRTVLEKIDEKPLVRDCVRVGVKSNGDKGPRPVKFTLGNSAVFKKPDTSTAGSLPVKFHRWKSNRGIR